MTPHSDASPGDYGGAVLMPGDPLRARWIAETLLDAPRLVNGIRGELGYSGTFRGKPVGIQAAGMGRPSWSIYLHELIAMLGVGTVIRIGTCGGLQENIRIRELVIAEKAIMEGDLAGDSAWAAPDRDLFRLAIEAAVSLGVAHHCGAMLGSDQFYHPSPENRFEPARAAGLIAVDMETPAHFLLAKSLGARALSICTVVDNVVSHEEINPSERQQVFGDMARVALEVACGGR